MKKFLFLPLLLCLTGCIFKEEIPFESKEIPITSEEEFNLSNYTSVDASSLYCGPIDYTSLDVQEITCQDNNDKYKETKLTITISDVTKPELALTTSRIQLPLNSTYDLKNYVLEAKDSIDGNLTNQVSYVDTINISESGTYEVIYTVTDKSGNSESASLIVDVTTFYDEFFDASCITPLFVSNPNDITVLVNKTNAIPKGWSPDDLVHVYGSTSGTVYLREEAANAYKKFVQAANSEGLTVIAFSGYRTNDLQTRLYTNYLRNNGYKYTVSLSAYPGRSEHQLGLAIDISDTWSNPLSESLGNRALGQFIQNEAHKYGFILRYQKDKTAITNYAYEPWHIRYVGLDLATYLYENNLTLEEYYEQK